MKGIDLTFNKIAAIFAISLGCILLTFGHIVDEATKDTLKTLVGLAGFYLFGSTAGSQAKDASIQQNQSDLVDALQKSTPIKNV